MSRALDELKAVIGYYGETVNAADGGMYREYPIAAG